MAWKMLLEIQAVELKISLKRAYPDAATLGKPREPRESVWKHKHAEAALLGTWPWVSQNCTEIKHKPAPPGQNTCTNPAENTDREQEQSQVILQRPCIQANSRRGEIPGERVCVGWGFSASVLFFVKQPSEKAPEKAERAHKSQQSTGASCPTACELIRDVCTAGRTRAQNPVLPPLG